MRLIARAVTLVTVVLAIIAYVHLAPHLTMPLLAASTQATESSSIAQPCIHYEPDSVQLTGVIAIEQHYGPPGYGDSPEVDEPYKAAFLDLESPIALCGRSTELNDQPALTNVTRVQLGFSGIPTPISATQGRRAAVRGTLYHRFSGYHYADVIMAVARFDTLP